MAFFLLGTVYIDNGKINICFELGKYYGKRGSFSYNIGEGITDYSATNLIKLNQAYIALIKIILNEGKSTDALFDYINDKHSVLGMDNPCTLLHTSAFIQSAILALSSKKLAFEKIREFILGKNTMYMILHELLSPDSHEQNYERYFRRRLGNENSDVLQIYISDGIESLRFFLYLLKAVILENIKIQADDLNKEFAILFDAELLNYNLSATQKLYIMDERRSSKNEKLCYINNGFKTRWFPSEYINNSAELIKNNVEISEIIELNCIEDIIRYEMTKIVTEKVLLVKCENCGFYFVPQGRADSKYCYRINGNEEKPCCDIGAHRKYINSITVERKYYVSISKHYYYLVNNNRISQNDYYVWSEYNQAQYVKYKNKEISFETLKKWLDLDVGKAIKKAKLSTNNRQIV